MSRRSAISPQQVHRASPPKVIRREVSGRTIVSMLGSPSDITYPDLLAFRLHEFMWPHLESFGKKILPPACTMAEYQNRDVSPSVVGQASTIVGEDASDPIQDLDDVDAAMRQVYKSIRGDDPGAIVMQERVEHKGALLMDGTFPSSKHLSLWLHLLRLSWLLVPNLPAPNIHSLPFAPLMTLKDLLRAEGVQNQRVPTGLKKISGIRILNIELPWR